MINQAPDIPHIFEDAYYQRLYAIEERHWWARGMRAVMHELLAPRLVQGEPLRILDVGCGTGYLLGWAQRYSPAIEPVGVDLAAHALRFCRARNARDLALASAVQLPFAAQSFDLIICIDTLQHLAPAGADAIALIEFARLLRPGGLLYLRTNSALGHRSLQGVDPDHYRRYTLDTVGAMLSAAGLTTERATYINALPGLWGFLREYLSPARQSAPIGPGLTIAPSSPSRGLVDALLYQELLFEAKIIGSGASLPFGHSSAYLARRPER